MLGGIIINILKIVGLTWFDQTWRKQLFPSLTPSFFFFHAFSLLYNLTQTRSLWTLIMPSLSLSLSLKFWTLPHNSSLMPFSFLFSFWDFNSSFKYRSQLFINMIISREKIGQSETSITNFHTMKRLNKLNFRNHLLW